MAVKNFAISNLLSDIGHYTVCAMVFFVPLFFIPSPFISETAKLVFVFAGSAILFLTYLLKIIISGKLAIPKRAFLGALISFFVISGISAILSGYRFGSFWGADGGASASFLMIISMVAFTLAIIELADSRERLFIYVFCFILSSYVVLILGALQILKIFPFNISHFTQGDFWYVGSFTEFSIFVFSASILSLAVFFYADEIFKKGKWGRGGAQIFVRIFLAGNAILGFCSVLISGRKPLALAAALAFFLLVVTLVIRARKYASKFFIIPAVFFALVLLPLFYDFDFSVGTINKKASFGVSIALAKKALREKIFFGFGPSSYGIVSSRFFPASAHSYALALVTDLGILGFASWLILAFSAAVASVKNMINVRDRNQLFFSGLFISWFFVFICLFLFNAGTAVIFIFWFLLSLIFAWLAEGSHFVTIEFYRKNSILFPLPIIFLAALLIVSYFTAMFFAADVFLASALEKESALAFQKEGNFFEIKNAIHKKIKNAVVFNPLGDAILRKASFSFLDQFLISKNMREFVEESVKYAKAAVSVSPGNPENHKNLAEIYSVLAPYAGGAAESAIQSWIRAIELSPENAAYHAHLGGEYIKKFNRLVEGRESAGDEAKNTIQKADAALQKALSISPYDSAANAVKGDFYITSGRKSEAKPYFEKAIAFGSDDPNNYLKLAILYIDDKEFEKAAGLLEAAIFKYPAFSNAMWYRALLYEKENKIEEAALLIEKILRLNPENAESRAKLEKLREILSR